MPEIRFSKMHGGGNDFVVIDAVRQRLPNGFSAAQIANRRTGVGCDQVLILHKSAADDAADFRYQILNADGGESGQCGNGARCAHAFLLRQQLTDKKRLCLRTMTTDIITEEINNNRLRAYLSVPQFAPTDIPLNRPKTRRWYTATAAEGAEFLPGKFAALSLGNPHAIFINNRRHELATAGKMLNERRQLFPQGVNVGFCQLAAEGIWLRVYERGVGETPSCGSGAAAAAIVMLRGRDDRDSIVVKMSGGELLCGWSGGKTAVWLEGEINFVFDGTIHL